jgi:hypothetical protein
MNQRLIAPAPAPAEKKQIRCQICYEIAESQITEKGPNFMCINPVMLDGSIAASWHLWRHIMKVLPDIYLKKIVAKDMDTLDSMHKRLLEIQEFSEPMITDPMTRIKTVEIDPDKAYEKVVGKMDEWF